MNEHNQDLTVTNGIAARQFAMRVELPIAIVADWGGGQSTRVAEDYYDFMRWVYDALRHSPDHKARLIPVARKEDAGL